MDTCKDASSTATPTKLTIVKAFCPYDLITAHFNEYHGATCSDWKRDLEWLLAGHGIHQQYAGLVDLQLNQPERAQLRKHLLKWGFVKETAIEQIIDVTVEKRVHQRWVVNIRTNKQTWALCSITPEGLRRYDGITNETAFTLDGDMIHLVR